MQLKIINEYGPPRCGPPTKGTSREGPGIADSWQLAVDKIKSTVSSQQSAIRGLVLWKPGTCNMQHEKWNMLGALVVKRRWGEAVDSWQLTVDSYQSAVGSRQSAVSRQSSIFSLEHWNTGTLERLRFRSPRARDWINCTCSVSQQIKQYRYKDRSGEKGKPARGGGVGEVCLNV
jgi:hypothetical protein